MSEEKEVDLIKAVERARQELRTAREEVKKTIGSIRPEEPLLLLRKARKTMGKPLRRRLRKRIDELFKKSEGEG